MRSHSEGCSVNVEGKQNSSFNAFNVRMEVRKTTADSRQYNTISFRNNPVLHSFR